MLGSPTSRLAASAGRALLIGAVVCWWGAVVIPGLAHLIAPSLFAPLPMALNPDSEYSLTNALSAIVLFLCAATAGTVAVIAGYRKLGFINAGGWFTIAVTSGLIGWHENSLTAQVVRYRGGVLRDIAETALVALVYVVLMTAFVWRGRLKTETRRLIVYGTAAWILAILFDATFRLNPPGWVYDTSVLFEETLEFAGTLFFILAALSEHSAARPRYRWPLWLAGIAVVVVGASVGFDRVSAWRETVVDTRGPVLIKTSLPDGFSVIQELGQTSGPLNRIDLRAAGTLDWRVRQGDGLDGPIRREGRIRVASDRPSAPARIDFPVLHPARGRCNWWQTAMRGCW